MLLICHFGAGSRERDQSNERMSSGLMSCVRENSPPLEMDTHASGPLSLPESNSNMNVTDSPLTNAIAAHSHDGVHHLATSMVPTADPKAEQQKRRRFHPLRNLRRIFRRRTITSVNDTPAVSNTPQQQQQQNQQTLPPPNSSNSEKNLRSATLGSISSTVSASSPSSPLTHQQLLDAYSSQSLPKSKSYGCNFASKAHRDALLLAASNNNTAFKALQQQQQQQQQQQHHHQQSRENQEADSDEMYTTASTTTTSYQHQHHHAHTGYQRQSMGVAVFPSAMSRSFFTERQKLRSIGDSSQELDSSGHESGMTAGGVHRMSGGGSGGGGHGSTGEMTDSQRSLSEGRLVDSDYSRDQLSQSHDSVFSESATASSLSIVLKAELADVLRKRRNRPDASDEDLGLPRSPASPQRRNEQQQHSQNANAGGTSGNNNNQTATNTPNRGNQSEVSSLSLLSMNSTDAEDGGILAASTANNSMNSPSDVMLERNTTTTSRYTRSSTISTVSSGTSSAAATELRHSMSTSSCHDSNRDEVDLFSRDWQRLSHAAAKHKMAVRPAKKKGPSRQHRRTLETAIPEANEDGFKVSNNHFLNVMDLDARAKTRSLPPGVNTKLLEQHAGDEKLKITANNNNTNNTTITTVNTAKSTLDSSVNNNLKPQQQQSTKVDKEMTTKTKMTTTTTTSSNNSSVVSVNSNNNNNNSNTMSNMFGLRLLSAKASAIFDAKESVTDEQKNTNNNVVIAAAASSSNNMTTTTTVETTESGFLRRLIQRNSKRSIAARSNAGGDDELDTLQSEPKKLQISSSCYDTRPPHYDLDVEMLKSKSVTACEHNIEEKRREIKREIKSEGKSGLSAMLNNFMLAEKSIPAATTLPSTVTKPKSGPAARQRYMPQDLVDTLERKPPVDTETNSVTTVTTITSDNGSSKELLSGSRAGGSLRAKQLHSETFQSTSIIREITASQAASAKTSNASTNASSIVAVKPEHHFEKKPKIVGLSAFQQKISRSNECFVRHSSTSNNSLEASNEMIFIGTDSDEPLKQRKSVEKSRSFRTYEEERTMTTETVSNMPSLPDLSLNLRVPCFMLGENIEKGSPVQSPQHDKSVSLGFEINDNNLMRTTLRAESAKQLHITNNNALLTPAQMMPQLSPTNSQNISEIEQNIDLLMKSPYVNVQIRKTPLHVDEAPAKAPISVESAPARPKVLQLLRERAASEERLLNELSPASPTTAAVPLREKTCTSSASRASHEVHTTTTPTTPPIKEGERKSAPTSIKLTRRSSSLLERIDQPDESSTDEVPEFMKIQLNRVDPNTRAAKSNVVLAKNVKATPSPTTPTTTPTVERVSDDILMRRYSNESVDIHERDSSPDESPERVPCVLEAVNRQASKTLNISGVCMSSTDLSPTKATPSVTNSTAVECEPESPVELRNKSSKSVTTSSASSKLSLQERKRLFMHDERAKTDKRIEELRNERKKSINEELFRKSYAKSEEQLSETTTTTSTMTTTVISASTSTLLTENEKYKEQENIKEVEKPKEIESMKEKEKEKDSSTVIMRKKSFGITGTLNGNNNNISNNNNSSNNNPNHKSKDDPTPELMKVFARRSLKVKEEDLQAFSEKLNNSHAHSNVAYKRYSQHVPASTTTITTNTGNNSMLSSATTITTLPPQQQQQQQQQQSVDSDKENQSASDEKLDKLPKHEVVAIEQLSGISKMAINTSANNGNIGNGNNLNLSHNGNRNSLADFRMNAVVLGKQNGAANNTNSNNNNINNNNNNNNNSLTHSSTNSTKISTSYLPSATQRVTSNYRMSVTSNGKIHAETQHNNHNNNNNNNNNNSNSNSNSNNNSLRHHSTLERPALQLKSNVDIATATPIVSSSELSSKAIERSATVSEFKGIHQRRAEWEQRAKEALK